MAITKETVTKFLLEEFSSNLSYFINENIESNPNDSDEQHILKLVEFTRELINNDLSVISEGFISNVIYEIDQENLIDFEYVLEYLREDK